MKASASQQRNGNVSAAPDDRGADWRIYRKIIENNYANHQDAYDRLRGFVAAQAPAGYRFFDIACGDAGLTTLRFNFRGVGASTGEHNEIEGGKEDVRDVLNYIGVNYTGEDLTLAGFSFGSRTALEVGYDENRVARLISVGTPIDKYGDYDFLTRTRKPILFIHGDKDEFGSVDKVRRLVEDVSKNADTELVVFENSGHFLDEHLNELREAVRDWVSRKIQTG